jgi:hypothetical protein
MAAKQINLLTINICCVLRRQISAAKRLSAKIEVDPFPNGAPRPYRRETWIAPFVLTRGARAPRPQSEAPRLGPL